ncbi:hypothetical protein chiPu_0018594 [Chiloscyllium punctatum]|uniref:Uncharacterized protein n=1 Tax=Chiloscyllium punctatum TaxID=137246 RepID=A0A401RNW5_CHIPU|nr:hypothetical protein [Chiloscyllium punctatum]
MQADSSISEHTRSRARTGRGHHDESQSGDEKRNCSCTSKAGMPRAAIALSWKSQRLDVSPFATLHHSRVAEICHDMLTLKVEIRGKKVRFTKPTLLFPKVIGSLSNSGMSRAFKTGTGPLEDSKADFGQAEA